MNVSQLYICICLPQMRPHFYLRNVKFEYENTQNKMVKKYVESDKHSLCHYLYDQHEYFAWDKSRRKITICVHLQHKSLSRKKPLIDANHGAIVSILWHDVSSLFMAR